MTSTPTARVHRTFRGILLIAVCVSLSWTTAAHAQRGKKGESGVALRSSAEFRAAFREAVAGPARGTVRVYCDGSAVALGAVVAGDGWIITKASELKGDNIACRLHDGRELPARLVGVQESYDLAMLKIEAKDLKPVSWAESKTAAVGNWLATPGLGDDPVAVGVVSVGTRKITGRELARRANNGGFLGVGLAPSKDAVIIMRIVSGGAADKAGLKADDRILAISDRAITNGDSLLKTLQKTKPGDVVVVRVKRDDEELELKVKLGKAPLDRSEFQNRMGSSLSDRRTGFPVILQHDTVLRPADCGGPLVDLDGKVIGINIARAGRTETYAIPAEVVQALLKDLKSGKLAPPK